MKNEKEDPENPVYPGLTKPGEVGDFFAMVSISVFFPHSRMFPYLSQKRKMILKGSN
jgi:hypothetical protein